MLDVTERKRLESQLLQAQKMESIGRLAGGIAHDFNNMMTVVLGYSDVIAENLPPSDPSRVPLAKIKDAAQRATTLTRQLLAFSRLQARFPVTMNLTAHITQFATMLPRLLGEDIELLLSLNTDLWNVSADSSQIDQVLMNLAVNARDAMPHGGKLVIETRNVELTESETARRPGMRSGEFVMMRVSDTGVGISPTTMPKIFEPFFTTKDKGEGTGLGLSTAYGIVKQSGGFIGVQSEVGTGTTFEIYLPHDCGLPKMAIPSESSPPKAAKSKKILLVEDEAALREIMSLMLGRLGHIVLSTCDGLEALRIADEQDDPIDLLLTDVVMPGMDGWELAERLHRKIPSVKVLFASGYSDSATLRDGRLPKGDFFLQKPLTKIVLEDKLREIFSV
jgi:nitrogen-specific signal transduction histidine kinase/CheY-like chemotaxis protein